MLESSDSSAGLLSRESGVRVPDGSPPHHTLERDLPTHSLRNHPRLAPPTLLIPCRQTRSSLLFLECMRCFYSLGVATRQGSRTTLLSTSICWIYLTAYEDACYETLRNTSKGGKS